MLTAPDLTLLFMGIVLSLAIALVWMLHELEPRLVQLRVRRKHVARDRIE